MHVEVIARVLIVKLTYCLIWQSLGFCFCNGTFSSVNFWPCFLVLWFACETNQMIFFVSYWMTSFTLNVQKYMRNLSVVEK